MNADSRNVDGLIAAMSRDLREPTREEAAEAWEAASEHSCASWLIFDRQSENDRDDAVRAFDSLMRERIERAFRAAIPEHERENAAEFVTEFLKGGTERPKDDALSVTMEGRAEPLGHLFRWSEEDLTLVRALVERFEVVLEERHLRLLDRGLADRSIALDAIGLRVVDADGLDA